MEDLVQLQETNMDLSMDRQETVLGTQSPIKRDIVNLSMEGQDPALGKGRGVTMSSQETAPDSLELDMDNPQLDMEAGNIGNPVLVRPVTVKDIQKTQVDSPWQLKEDLVLAQETNVDLRMARQETVLGTQHLIKGGTVNQSMKGQHLDLGKERGATMSSQGTAPDTLGLNRDKPPLDLEAAGTANPVLVRPVTVRDMQ